MAITMLSVYFLVEILFFSNFVILNGINKLCQNFTCLSSMGGAGVVDYLIGHAQD